jgi:hypothetical protein
MQFNILASYRQSKPGTTGPGCMERVEQFVLLIWCNARPVVTDLNPAAVISGKLEQSDLDHTLLRINRLHCILQQIEKCLS